MVPADPNSGNKEKNPAVGLQSPSNSNSTVAEDAPFNFSWFIDKQIAVFGAPNSCEHIKFLVSEGIEVIISLTEEVPKALKGSSFKKHHIPVKDHMAPALSDVQKFLNVIDWAKIYEKPVGVHCLLGRGRSGTMLACYLAHVNSMQADMAMQIVRQARPGSIEDACQEDLVREFTNLPTKIWVRRGTLPGTASHNPMPSGNRRSTWHGHNHGCNRVLGGSGSRTDSYTIMHHRISSSDINGAKESKTKIQIEGESKTKIQIDGTKESKTKIQIEDESNGVVL